VNLTTQTRAEAEVRQKGSIAIYQEKAGPGEARGFNTTQETQHEESTIISPVPGTKHVLFQTYTPQNAAKQTPLLFSQTSLNSCELTKT